MPWKRLRTSPMYAAHILPGPNGRVAPGTNTLSILAPPGNYTVAAWQEKLGWQEQTVKIAPAEKIKLSFKYKGE